MSLSERRWLRIFTLCVLYVAQGIPWGFMSTTLVGYLIDVKKLDFSIVTTTLSFTTLPYAFKWTMGPIIDRFTIRRFGRRRPWIIFAQAMMALTIGAMIALDVSTQIKLLAWMVFVHTVFNALQDVATDALATEILPEGERGSANGLMYGSKYLGGALGGVGMVKLIKWFGFSTALTVQACVLLAIMLVPLLVHERDGELPPRESARSIASALRDAFSLRSSQVTVLFMLGMLLASGMLSATGYQLFVFQLKWPYDKYVELTGGWGLVAGCVSAVTAGALSDKVGRKRVVTFAAVGLATSWIVFALAQSLWTNHTYIYVSAIIETVLQAQMTVAAIALCMDVAWPRIAGSQFTAYMALMNVSTTLGIQFAGRAVKWLSFSEIWLLAAVIQVAVLPLLFAIDPAQTRTELPFAPGRRAPRTGLIALFALLAFLIAFSAWSAAKVLG